MSAYGRIAANCFFESAITNADGAWSELELVDPILLSSGMVYRVSNEGGKYYRLYDNTPRTFEHGQILNSCYATDGFPSSTYSTYTDLVDFRYTVGHYFPIAMQPTNAVVFTNGVWSGNVVVGEYTQHAFLRAESSLGIRTDSPVFAAGYVGDLSVELPDGVDEGDGTLAGAGEVSVSVVAASNLLVNLMFDGGAEAEVPVQVIIPQGETNVLFNLTVLDGQLAGRFPYVRGACCLIRLPFCLYRSACA